MFYWQGPNMNDRGSIGWKPQAVKWSPAIRLYQLRLRRKRIMHNYHGSPIPRQQQPIYWFGHYDKGFMYLK